MGYDNHWRIQQGNGDSILTSHLNPVGDVVCRILKSRDYVGDISSWPKVRAEFEKRGFSDEVKFNNGAPIGAGRELLRHWFTWDYKRPPHSFYGWFSRKYELTPEEFAELGEAAITFGTYPLDGGTDV